MNPAASKDAGPYSPERPARVLALMPHPDDFEFNVGGMFALLRQRHGEAVVLKVMTTTTGATGHHVLDAEQTRARRYDEATKAAARIGAEFSFLTRADGTTFDRQFLVEEASLAALWNAIRSFRADLVIAPPPVSDPVAGVHIDHENTAQAVRLVAYQLGVPRAYPGDPAPDYRPPLIVLADDTYASEAAFDLRLDISALYPTKLAMAKEHRSQIYEWLPFIDQSAPPTEAEYEVRFRARHERVNARYGFADAPPCEYFRISRWGRAPREGEIAWFFGDALKNDSF
ncbi:MAG TPA: PIG-L family deacetylase [Chthoniobacteraceae bacterium]|nr:PIG-L family deacetylase [Chthoniobacteraceae bacterium]